MAVRQWRLHYCRMGSKNNELFKRPILLPGINCKPHPWKGRLNPSLGDFLWWDNSVADGKNLNVWQSLCSHLTDLSKTEMKYFQVMSLSAETQTNLQLSKIKSIMSSIQSKSTRQSDTVGLQLHDGYTRVWARTARAQQFESRPGT